MVIQQVGPGVESFTQPEVPPIEASFIGIELGPVPVEPGPAVRFRFVKLTPEQTLYPRVHAVFVPAITPNIASLSADDLLDPINGFPSNSIVKAAFAPISTLYKLPVSGLVGGVEYVLVTVLEYTTPD